MASKKWYSKNNRWAFQKEGTHSKGETKMTQKALKRAWENGETTSEQFDQMAAMIDQNPEEKSEENPKTGSEKESREEANMSEMDLERVVRSAVDRATNRIGNENKKLKEQLVALKKAKLSDDELKQMEFSEKEKEIEEREKAILEKENKLYAIKAIKKAGLDDGSDASLSLMDFVMGGSEEEINSKIKVFQTLFNKMVKAEVDRTFKKNGGVPEKSNLTLGAVNPFSKDTFNMTDQMKLEAKNPDLARQLKQAARLLKDRRS